MYLYIHDLGATNAFKKKEVQTKKHRKIYVQTDGDVHVEYQSDQCIWCPLQKYESQFAHLSVQNVVVSISVLLETSQHHFHLQTRCNSA